MSGRTAAGAGSGAAGGPGAPQARLVCPAEHSGWLTMPGRSLIMSPQRILRDLVHPGDTVVDLGCGPGFFTLPMAEMVGDGGSVIAVDLQAAMLARLGSRAERKGLAARVRAHQCAADTLSLDGEQADFALAFWMVHEVPDAGRFLGEVHAVLRGGARLLLVEPRGHVNSEAFALTEAAAIGAGLRPVSRPHVAFSRAALLERV
jgi:ubiquinone/menaquinone biosynthesis C-methylase UbiE